MEILVIGLGSMGKRRIRLLSTHFKNIKIIGVDKRSDRRQEAKRLFEIKVYQTIEEAFDRHNFIGAIVCTPPLSHYPIIKKCLLKGINVFTEINLIDKGYNEILGLSKKQDLYLFLSSTFMYRKEVEYITKKVKDYPKKVNYRYHVGQYLPDWHPWENYKDFFVKNIKTNGCRELLAIELPWIINAFGKIKEIKIIKDNISSLDINYPDTYNILFKHINGNMGNINVDVVARRAIRNLEVYSEDMHLFWNGTPNGLKEYDIEKKRLYKINTYDTYEQDTNYAENIIENAYLEELKIFINKIKGNSSSKFTEKYTFGDDLYTLSIIKQIEV